MATIPGALEIIKQQLHRFVTPQQVDDASREFKHEHRKRKLDPLTTIHLFLQQMLHANVSLAKLPRLSGIDFDPSAFCHARIRLPLAVLYKLLRMTADAIRDQSRSTPLWEDHRTWFADGSNASMPDTPELQKAFGQHKQQKKGCGFPIAHLLGLFDAFSGMIMEIIADPYNTHDMSSVGQLHPHLEPGDLLVADRGFCSYAHLSMLGLRGVFALFRVHQRTIIQFRSGPEESREQLEQRLRIKRIKHRPTSRFLRRLGHEDQLVEWQKPKQRPVWMTQEQYDALPPALIVREMRLVVKDKRCRVRQVTVVTTLLDHKKYTREKLAELYRKRWRVEEDLKALKTTLKMEVLHCKSEAGVRKELVAYALIYNLVCVVRAEAAQKQKVAAERISFSDVLTWMKVAEPGEPLPRMIVNPLRPGRHEPRVVKRRPKSHKLMKKPRAEYKKLLKNQAQNA